jgi:hypothetical protein
VGEDPTRGTWIAMVGAVEGRFRTLVLVSGGMSEGRPPEVSTLNFAPRVRVPVLMEKRSTGSTSASVP